MCGAENGGTPETRPGIAESFAPQLSGITADMQSDLQGIQKENRPPLSEGMLPLHLCSSLLHSCIACSAHHLLLHYGAKQLQAKLKGSCPVAQKVCFMVKHVDVALS